jgi:SMC interacting uncharacterized protein involved in chromosome segregation
MISTEKLNSKFNQFFAEKNFLNAKSISNEILNILDKDKFPVYTSLKNKETPFAKLFENYFESFYMEPNPNIQALKLIHFNISNRL